jgi:hypothetical protein
MPAKSRRNRRNISQGVKATINRSIVSPPTGIPAVEAARPEKTVNVYKSPARAAAAVEDSFGSVIKDIKWIGLVTAIVAVLLVILYIFLH